MNNLHVYDCYLYSCCEVNIAIVMQPTLHRTDKDVTLYAKKLTLP